MRINRLSLRAWCPTILVLAASAAAAPWQASWIGVDEPSRPNRWVCFRRTVSLDSAPTRATARIAADSKYWLWVNGDLAVFEGQLKRGPNPRDTYADTVDLTPYLRAGENSVAILLWYFGKHGFSHNDSGKAGLLFEADIDGTAVRSGSDWKARIHPAFGDTGKPHPNYRLPESNIRFDARADLPGWHLPGYDDSDWPAAADFGVPPTAPWHEPVERPIPLWRDSGLREYADPVALPATGTGKAIVARLPYNAHVTPYLKVEAPAGLTIDIRTDNYTGGGPPNVRAEYVTREGVQEYESLGWMNGHDVRYTIPEGVRVLDLKYRETGYDADAAGTFDCDDPFLNRLREKALRTLHVTMRDTYYDCPDRERAQWWGDEVNELGEAFYALDPRGALLARKGILELVGWQRADGTLFSPVPAGNWDKELPMQMLASVGFYGFRTYALYSGDLETMRTVYPGVKRYLALWQLGDDGLVVPRRGGWTWGDWGDNKDMNGLFNAWYYLALKGQRDLAEWLGNREELPEIRRRMATLEQAFREKLWDGSAYRGPGHTGPPDDRLQALAVVSGLAPPDLYPDLLKVFAEQAHSSAYMEKYVLEALFIMRAETAAIERIHTRYRDMVEHPCTTLWEDWRIGGSGGGTTNHAWSGGPLTLMSQYIAGIAPETPGYGLYRILPQLGPLTRASATVASVKGTISADIRREGGLFTLDVTSPPGTVALVGIPHASDTALPEVRVDGRGMAIAEAPGVETGGVAFAGAAPHYLLFRVAPGTHRFESRRATPTE